VGLVIPPFQKTPWRQFDRSQDSHFGQAYQSTEITPFTTNWVRYNIANQWWEYSIDNVNFYRLPENPYVPSDIYFKNRGLLPPEPPLLGEMKLYVRTDVDTPKLFALWSDGSEDLLATGPTPSLFPSGSVAFWKLGEAAGSSRLDSSGSSNLSDTSVVGQVVGKVGNAADFDTTSWLSCVDNPALSMGAGVSFEICGWVKLTAKTLGSIFSKDDVASSREYNLYYDDGADRFKFHVSLTGGAVTTISANTLGSPSNGTWYFFDCYYDSDSGNIGISINRGTFDTNSAGVGGIFNGTAAFKLGNFGNDINLLNAAIDAVVVYKRLLTTTERDNLYNLGNGRES